ncbi:hypothetical protein GCM10029976_082140 [Kribbella albertanoniae]|uniref:Uncharacterized protein n=1 Tax=Kribbella albertanoniae TaxID=1266829 RepID=A0A4R4PT98_9ACTN|nr:hypothetical protein [Kribbella albertanoniae]TDC25597.1 hypothetical protein E1261_23925 [Kribbella albertanoniae]
MLGELPRELAEDNFWVKLPPPLLSMIVFGLAFCFAGLLGVAGSDGTAVSDAFVKGVPWTVWRAVAGAALVVFALLTAQAVRILQHPDRWGFYPPPVRRRRYLVCAAISAAAVAGYRILFPGVVPDLPVQSLQTRTGAVLLCGMLAAIPWLTIVWLAHAECRELWQRDDDPLGEPHVHIRRLERLWQLLIVCVGAFMIGVAAAVAAAGALRGAFVSAHPDRADEFPPSNVLLYGGMFALGLAVIGIPMAVAWRNRAQQLVEHMCPLPANGRPSEEWLQERHRIEHLLHLDISILRNPLTILSVFAPLVVSALAAFLPQLAG